MLPFFVRISAKEKSDNARRNACHTYTNYPLLGWTSNLLHKRKFYKVVHWTHISCIMSSMPGHLKSTTHLCLIHSEKTRVLTIAYIVPKETVTYKAYGTQFKIGSRKIHHDYIKQ